MRTVSKRAGWRLLCVATVLLTGAVTYVLVTQRTVLASERATKPLSADQAVFFSDAAQLQRDPGTPIGPPKKVILCHCPRGNTNNCHTIKVPQSAVAAHLAHHPGDHLGPCTGAQTGHGDDQVMCHKAGNRRITIIVNADAVAAHLANGDYLNACTNQVFMCNLRLRTIVVPYDQIQDHLNRGQKLGLCPGKTLICHKGKRNLIVADASLPAHLAHGDCIGYCAGGQGPFIDPSTWQSRCDTNPPTALIRP